MIDGTNDFLDPLHVAPRVRRRGRWAKAFIVLSLVAAVLAAAATAYQLAAPASDPLASLLRHVPVVRDVARFINPQSAPLASRDTVYLAIGGISGVGNDGPLLTDTIMLVVLKPRDGAFGLISVPRDLAVATEAGAFRKVNSVYALAEARDSGSGLEAFKRALASITGAPVSYAAVINFSGFEQLIDAFGGVTVDVPHSFIDHTYPDGRGGVKTVSFTAGRQRLDGATALEYARSRHGSDGENSDFARARRQQLIAVSLMHEALQLKTLASPRRLHALADLLGDAVDTDLPVGDAVDVALQFQNADPDAAPRLVIDDGPNGFLNNAIGPDGAFLLTPRGGSFAQIQRAVADLFDAGADTDEVTVAVENGTDVSGLALRVADRLAAEQFRVSSFGNAGRQDVARTVIYDHSDGHSPLARSRLAELFPGSLIISGTGTSTADFVVLIGRDFAGGV